MIRFLTDEDFNHDILRGVVRRVSGLDIVRVQDIGLRGADDDTVLAAAAEDERVLLTHDVSTLVARAYERVARRQPMPGVIAVPQALSVGMALLGIVDYSTPEEWRDQVRYLPL
ncbi:MAG: DUF5615 family PIN-like protein [Polyangiaceae bacterium]|nr:DUF5615 family PIN-like protein [Polyangiaceae bacterium]